MTHWTTDELLRFSEVLGHLADETQIVLYKQALTAGQNLMAEIVRQEEAALRQPDDWIFCEACGKAYSAINTNSELGVRTLVPSCRCHNEIIWHGRPANDNWSVGLIEGFIEMADKSWANLRERRIKK